MYTTKKRTYYVLGTIVLILATVLSCKKATVKEVLEILAAYGIPPKDLNGCVILVNGNSASKRSKLTDGDTVVLMSPVAGG